MRKRTSDLCLITVGGKYAFLTLTRSTWLDKQKKAESETLVNVRVLNRPDDIEAAKKTLKSYSKNITYLQ